MENLHIIGLRAENIMRLRAVEIKPGPDGLVIIGGQNGEGKTSILESIVMALGGTKAMPPQPVRRLQKAAIVVLDLGDIIITRSFKEDQSSTLEVKSKDGARFSSPQKLLETLVGRVAFDPIHFQNLDPQKQLATLREIVNLDFTELDTRYANAYGKRTDVSRELAKLKARSASLSPFSDQLPASEVDVVELSQRVATAERIGDTLNDLEMRGREAAALVNETKDHITRLEKELQNWRDALLAKEAILKQLRADYEAKFNEAKAIKSAELIKELDGVNEKNKSIRLNNERHNLDGDISDTEAELAALEKELGDVAIEKEKALTSAKFPIDGLSFNDKGVLFNGVPFEQASGADKLRTSLAMGIALNPKVRVMIIRDGSLLDNNNLAVVREMAQEHNVQVWIERVGDGDECSIIIEDGEVLENRIENPVEDKPKVNTKGTRKPTTAPRFK